MSPLKEGDEVRVSAKFLRSICPNAARGWPTTMDPGKGVVVSVLNDWLVTVCFYDPHVVREYHVGNLVSATPKEVYKEAMRAEHSPRDRGLAP